MADNALFSTAVNHSAFDNEGLEMLPLITKERTQKFDLLLHLIPNLKQHLILCGTSGIGKTLLLDMLYDIDSDIWQCCFVQGSAELSFETIEAQLIKTMLRNKHTSLDNALHDFQEQNKKIVLIIDDAGLLVSGLMTTLIDYAAAQPVIKLIFSLTPEARNTCRKIEKGLEEFYLLEIPPLNKRQCDYFLRHLAAKPRTYNAIQIDEKLLDKIYFSTKGIPALIINDFTKLSRQNQTDYTKWIAIFAGLVVLAGLINQGIRYFKNKTIEDETQSVVLPVEKIEKASPVAKTTSSPIESETKSEPEQDIIIPEFKLDIEKGITSSQSNTTESEATATTIEKTAEKSIEQVTPAPVEPEKLAPIVEKIPEPEKSVEPPIAFPKVEPAKGMKIKPLPEKTTIEVEPIPTPKIKNVKIEPVKKVEIKSIEKPVEVKKPEPPKIEPIKKIEPEKIKEKTETDPKVETVIPPAAGRYALQLITLSSEAAIQEFQKKHPMLKNARIVKSGSDEKPRFALMYGGFANNQEAEKARESLPAEFANALPRKSNP